MDISCCASISQCKLVSDCGFDRVVLSAAELARSTSEQLCALRCTMDERRLSCRALNDFCPPELKLCGPDYQLASVKDYVSRLAPRAAALGVRQIGVGAPLSRMVPPGFPAEVARAQFLECMTLAAQLCAPYQLRILIEPICRQATNLINTTPQALQFVLTGGQMDLVYDIYHAFMMGEDPTALRPAMDYIKIVHIAHADHGRRPPTRDTIHRYLPYLQMLHELGYQGELAAEFDMTGVTPDILEESCRVLKTVGASGAQAALR